MAHFAQIDENNVVTRVIVADAETIATGIFGDPKTFVQTSYNTRKGVHYGADGQPDGGTPFRKNYAGVGYTYDSVRDAFIPGKECASWVLNEETCFWEPPKPYPTDGKMYRWNESLVDWEEVITQ